MRSIKHYWIGSAVLLAMASMVMLTCPGACATIWANKQHSYTADIIMKAGSYLAEWPVIAVSIGAYLLRDWRLGIWAAVCYAMQGLTVNIIKNALNAPRPVIELSEAGLRHVDGIHIHAWQAFPSGHTASAFMGLGILASLYRAGKWQFILILIAAVAGYSRLYLGQHYLHDVIGGACISLIWLMFFVHFKHKFRSFLIPNGQQ